MTACFVGSGVVVNLLSLFQMFLDNLIPRNLVRLIAAVAGIIIGLVSIGVPLNFYLNLFSHPAAQPSPNQLGFWDGVSGSMLVLIFFAVFGFISLLLIKFAFTRPGSPDEHPVDDHATQE
ncbi:MAG: hypothetical protein KGL02_00230 [Acidobacteriota bacterium]|nr:hypothetical protein [Acidobacteriota bacterium]